MRYGFVLPDANVRTAPELAHEAEEAGWDVVFIPDCIYIDIESDHNMPAYDPWVVLAAIAVRTERVIIGPMITPLSRRRPWKVARETATLDILSNGRLVLPVGLGALDDAGFERVGEATGRKERAEMLDEALDIIAGCWSGQRFSYQGQHFQVRDLTFLPTPVQSPRIPVWVVGAWPREKSMRRVMRWDGLLPNTLNPDGSFRDTTPEDIRAMKAYAEEHRTATTPFDIIMEGVTPGDDPDRGMAAMQPFAEAGATWWIEAMWSAPNAPEDVRRRLRQGPPR